MTLDEAIEMHTNNAEYERTHGNLQGCRDFKQLAEWLRELKAYKGQQSCEDCISRQAAIEAINKYGSVWMEYTEVMSTDEIAERALKASKQSMIKILHDMPSVTPANVYVKGYKDAMAVHEKLKVEHKGKWIVWTDDRKDYAKCSCCGYGEEGEVLWKDTTKFCPWCGADMRGEEE